MNSDFIIDLYKKQGKILCYYLIKHGCNAQDAEDIVQDSFIKALQYIDGIERDKVSSWLFTVVMNEFKNRLKRNKIIAIHSIDNENNYLELVEPEMIENKVLSRELNNKIVTTLNKLKESEKSLLIMKYDMDLSYREISGLIGINEDVTKTYLYRARNKFKKEWRNENE